MSEWKHPVGIAAEWVFRDGSTTGRLMMEADKAMAIVTREEARRDYSCFYATPKTVFDAFRFRDSPTGDCGDYMRRLDRAGYRRVHHEDVKMLHLPPNRPRRRREHLDQLRRGHVMREAGKNPWKVLFHSMTHLEPLVLRGYWEE